MTKKRKRIKKDVGNRRLNGVPLQDADIQIFGKALQHSGSLWQGSTFM